MPNHIPACGRTLARLTCFIGAVLCLALQATTGNAANDHGGNALSVFPSIEGVLRSASQGDTFKRNDAEAAADVLLALKRNRFRLLGELVVAQDEVDLERFQIGFEPVDNTVVWLGRFHQPASAWNLIYHHGQYLQTSITRPWIENWEDDGGMLPQHVMGLLVESQFAAGQRGAWRTSAGYGISPRLEAKELVPTSVTSLVSKGRQGSGPHASIRIEWLPDPVGEDAVGIMASSADTTVDRTDNLFGPRIRIDTVGAYFSKTAGLLRTTAAIYSVHVRMPYVANAAPEHHVAGYVQADYSLRENTTPYARHENLSNALNSSYLNLHERAFVRRNIVGVRQQLSRNSAVSIELSRNSPLHSRPFSELRLQWSAALP
jgi:hypothetical protein